MTTSNTIWMMLTAIEKKWWWKLVRKVIEDITQPRKLCFWQWVLQRGIASDIWRSVSDGCSIWKAHGCATAYGIQEKYGTWYDLKQTFLKRFTIHHCISCIPYDFQDTGFFLKFQNTFGFFARHLWAVVAKLLLIVSKTVLLRTKRWSCCQVRVWP